MILLWSKMKLIFTDSMSVKVRPLPKKGECGPRVDFNLLKTCFTAQIVHSQPAVPPPGHFLSGWNVQRQPLCIHCLMNGAALPRSNLSQISNGQFGTKSAVVSLLVSNLSSHHLNQIGPIAVKIVVSFASIYFLKAVCLCL